MSAPVDVRAVLDGAIKVLDDATKGGTSDTLGGVTVENVQAALRRIAGKLEGAREARAAFDGLIDAAKFASDVCAELYAKYQVRVGPYASQVQLANVKLGAALRAAGGEQPTSDAASVSATDEQIREWMERHSLDGLSLTDARAAFEDAESLVAAGGAR